MIFPNLGSSNVTPQVSPRIRHVGLIGALFILTSTYSYAQTSQGFQNGTFESDYSDWTASGHQRIATSDPSHPASNGSKVVVFNPGNDYPDAVLSQVFATTPGQRYGLAFDLGTVGAIADQWVRVTLEGDGVLLDRSLVVTGRDAGAFYTPQHLSFVANSASTKLTFADVSNTYFVLDCLLDNIRISAENSEAPIVTSQPRKTAAAQGGSATFNVEASGAGPLSYQWQFDGRDIPGANGISYTIAAANATQAGNYRVVITNAAGSVESSAATLTVLLPALLLNGSFEYGSAAWSFSNRDDVSTSTNAITYGATDGVELVHFNFAQRRPNGRLSQRFATTAGQEYVLAFDIGAASQINRDEQRMRVTVEGDQMLLSQELSVWPAGVGRRARLMRAISFGEPQNLPPGTRYRRKRFRFVADSSTSTLTFEDVSPRTVDVDLLLDNVQVALYETGPRTWQISISAVFISGVLALWWGRLRMRPAGERRRQQQPTVP
jgi:hypothetical protein